MKHLVWIILFVTELAFAKTRVICQSELLKRGLNEPWTQAIYHDSDAFEVELLPGKKARLLDGDIVGFIECSLSDTKIYCKKDSGGRTGIWTINRISGTYEFYLSALPDNKVRGRCVQAEKRAF